MDVQRPCKDWFSGSWGIAEKPRSEGTKRRTAEHARAERTHQRPSKGLAATVPSFSSFAGGLVDQARAYIGRSGPSLGLPARLWCSDFMNMVTAGGTGSRAAKSWLAKPHVSPQVGAVVVTSRRGGGHVGIVSGFTAGGDPIVISGNHGRRVGEGIISRGRVLAYVSP
ncbi:CHAP domain-containing protein [Bradyrhizobium sp. RT10b]|uniref:CHAP domain-containing protein n=1 Tax=Bradyrhizobium sp. RT10b TaxID=3156331 RepID=UPI0033954A62